MNIIFVIVYAWLHGISYLTGLSYTEINIIVWYIVIPLSWIFLLELPRRKFKLTIISSVILTAAVIIITIIYGFRSYCQWLFFRSQDFLNAIPFSADVDYNYVISSVVICVFVPAVIYYLLYLRNREVIKNNMKMILITLLIVNAIIAAGAYFALNRTEEVLSLLCG